jgi:hypothetical protein
MQSINTAPPPVQPDEGDSPEIHLVAFDRGPRWDQEKERNAVRIRSYLGNQYVDIRTLFRAREGHYLPTQKGVTIRRGELARVIEALTRAQAIMDGEPDPGGEAVGE